VEHCYFPMFKEPFTYIYSEVRRRLTLLRKSADEHDQLLSTRAHYTGRIQAPIVAAYYRGGTSRAIIFREEDLPKDPDHRRSLFLQAIGAPDRHGRQLNGMGAGISSLSKICIVRLRDPADPVAELDYTFVGIGIENDEVDYAGNCGNVRMIKANIVCCICLLPFAVCNILIMISCHFGYCIGILTSKEHEKCNSPIRYLELLRIPANLPFPLRWLLP
jgi:hypothetical protein